MKQLLLLIVGNSCVNIQFIEGRKWLSKKNKNSINTSAQETLDVIRPAWWLWLDDWRKSARQIPRGSSCDLDRRDLFSEWTPPCRDDGSQRPAHGCSGPAEGRLNSDGTARDRPLPLHRGVLTWETNARPGLQTSSPTSMVGRRVADLLQVRCFYAPVWLSYLLSDVWKPASETPPPTPPARELCGKQYIVMMVLHIHKFRFNTGSNYAIQRVCFGWGSWLFC